MRPPIEQLDSLGPNVPARAWSTDDAAAYVSAFTAGARENFHVLSRFMPDAVRSDVAAVYAYCRWADDLADEAPAGEAPTLLRWWRSQLEDCFLTDTDPTHPVFAALRESVARHALPIEPFAQLLDAFDQDQLVIRYESWDQLLGYCKNSANPVGRIVLILAGHRPSSEDPASAVLERWSDDICTGLQLVNFWQDVRRDLLDRDRIYIPFAESGFSPETLADWANRPGDPEARVPFIKAMRTFVEKTRPLFESAPPLAAAINPEFQRAIRLFASGGLAIADKIEAMGCATLWRRPKLSAFDKILILSRASLPANLRLSRTSKHERSAS